jgi:hypothetical protein
MSEVKNPKGNRQIGFLFLLPEIDRRLRAKFRGLDAESKEEAVKESVLHCVRAYVRLSEQGRAQVATSNTLATYAAKQTRSGRPAVCSANSNDVLSPLGRARHGLQRHGSTSAWVNALTDSKQASVPDIVATRVDFRSWFATLSLNLKGIAADLALGNATSYVARKYIVSPSRISQLRRALHNSWVRFQSENKPAVN